MYAEYRKHVKNQHERNETSYNKWNILILPYTIDEFS